MNAEREKVRELVLRGDYFKKLQSNPVMTPENKIIIEESVNANLDRYSGYREMYDHAKKVADLTGYRSGFFGVPFGLLLEYLKEKIQEEKHSDEL